MLDVFYAAMDDLVERRGRRPIPRNPRLLGSLFSHLLATDPASAIVAEDHGRVVAFGMGHRRGVDGFLSFLFVLPTWQRRGLGRAVLAACYRAMGRPERMATCAEADQPVSTGLYASLGMSPRTPIYLLTGELDLAALPAVPAGRPPSALDPAAVAALDRAILGYERPADHAAWLDGGRRGWLVAGPGGALHGYGYVHQSGRLGPVAASDPAHLPSILGQLVRSIQPPAAWQVVVPGPAATALGTLLAAGMRIDGTPAVYCADHAGPSFERYVPMSFALL